jgi:pilus assembly protein CpaE
MLVLGAPKAAAAATGGHDVVAFLDDPASLAVVEQLCAQEGDGGPRIVQKGNVRDAIRCLGRLASPPRLLLVDVSGFDLPISEVDALADVCEPNVRVVVIGDREDVGLFRQLIRLGIADYIVKPLNIDLLLPHLGDGGSAASRAAANRSGKLVVVSGARGGVGTTTIAANLGWFQANNRKRRAALIDLDFHNGTLGAQLDLGTGELAEVLASSRRLDPLIIERTLRRHGSRLVLLSGETALDHAVPLEPNALQNLIELLEQQYHYVIVDLPRLPGAGYGYLLKRAAVRVLVANRTMPAARSLARLLELAENGDGRSVLVLNEDRPLAAGLVSRAMLEETLRRSFDVEIPYVKQVPLLGDNLGQPLAARSNGFTDGIERLVASLVGERPRTPTLWQRLRGRR